MRDEETGVFWTPTALPIRENTPYTVRHGFGYTFYGHTDHGIEQELRVFVANHENLKISRLKIKNLTDRVRKLSATYFVELVMGTLRADSARFIVTDFDSSNGAIIARNPHNIEFSGRVLYVATDADKRTWTCDRKEFIGRNGSLARPAAMLQRRLSGTSGAGFDPCCALQTNLEIEPGGSREIVFLLGEDESLEAAQNNIARFSRTSEIEAELERVRSFWDDLTSAVKVETPNDSMDLILNGWLVYQTLASRLWARTAFYQSSGAFGFRDQLQDVMSLIYTRPDLTRDQILHAAAHQFKEGDVLHWWHEPSNKGTRTRFSDDLLWLAFVTCYYIEKTGDKDILDQEVPFIEAPLLDENEMEVYLQSVSPSESANLYEHCIRAIEKSLRVGIHGLPLIGAGDWNDGMNSIGNKGKGESVWVGWFLIKILEDFSSICDERGERKLAKKYRGHAKQLRKSINRGAWDGKWYRRAYFDDGTPVGSSENEECRIDSIAQSWSVIAGNEDAGRSREAMNSVGTHLIRKDEKIALLLAPPFDKSKLEPGYIKAYTPGIRENGAQYTHAATWTVIAYALMGYGDQAEELFSMLNPINHTLTAADIGIYKTEPYAVAADVYSNPQHIGRGGWTWYTGAAGWLYQAGIEYILGFRKRGDTLLIDPCIPADWPGFRIVYRLNETRYEIEVKNPTGVSRGIKRLVLDGRSIDAAEFPLVDDGNKHLVHITLG